MRNFENWFSFCPSRCLPSGEEIHASGAINTVQHIRLRGTDYSIEARITFCIDTGVTLFGIVDQDYKLPEDVLAEIGLDTFDFESFQADTFDPDTFTFETFEAESIQPDTLGITMLRRGVIGVSKIGYVAS